MNLKYTIYALLLVTISSVGQSNTNCVIKKSNKKKQMETQINVFNKDLEKASDSPKTGFYLRSRNLRVLCLPAAPPRKRQRGSLENHQGLLFFKILKD